MQAKLSIIVPSFNNANELDQLLSSIQQQHFKDFEVLVIDGGSTDNTSEIVRKHESLVGYYVSEKDQGIYDAMNKGILASKGEWLYFIGCDDRFYSEDALTKVFAQEDASKDVMYGKIYNNTKQMTEGKEICSKTDLIHISIWHQSVFYRRSVFNEFGLYQLQYKIAADVAFNLSTFSQIFDRWKFIDVVVSLFSGDGISSTTIDVRYHNDQIALYKKWFSDVESHELYRGLQHHLYNQIKLGNYGAAFFEYVVLFFRTKERFSILRNALYYFKQKLRSN